MRAVIGFRPPARRFPLNRSLHLTWLAAGFVALLVPAAGCDNRATNIDNSPPPTAASDPNAEAPAPASQGAADAVSVTIQPWQEIVAAATADGRPAVIDVWALSCEPCLKSFPELVRLHNTLGDQVHCVSANVDFDGRRTRPPESYANDVREFLQTSESTLANYISATPSDEVYAELGIPSIPAVLVFDADGTEVARFVDAGETVGFTYRDHVIPFVRTLIAGDDASPSSSAAASSRSEASADE